MNRGGIADLPLLGTLLAIRQKSREPRFWEVMDSFVLLAYASLAASRTLLQRLLACLNFNPLVEVVATQEIPNTTKTLKNHHIIQNKIQNHFKK